MSSPRPCQPAGPPCARARPVAGALVFAWALALGASATAAAPGAAGSLGKAPDIGLGITRVAPGEPPMRLDGRLDEPAWQRAPAHDRFTTFLPVAGEPAPVAYRTTVRFVLEPAAIVLAVRSEDPQPDQIRAPLLRRDQVRRDQDFVALFLDAVGDRRSAQFIRVNAAGVVADGTFIADRDSTVDGQDAEEDYAPDFDVEAATTRDEHGWTVELRVPLSVLRLPVRSEGAPARPWRAMVTRSIPRESSTLLLSAPLPREALSFIAALQPFEGVDDTARRQATAAFLDLRPELTWRRVRESGQAARHETILGAAAKWRPRPDWVVDATLNPDFSQVELDVPQLSGNTRFALAVPEKRAFFLESTDVLDLPLAAFYSRSITDPRLGLRATWRGEAGDATALAVRDDGGGSVLLPGPYGTSVVPQPARTVAGLMRARWHRSSEDAGRLTLGFVGTSRVHDGGGRNDVAGADLLWRPAPGDRVRLRALASHADTDVDPVGGGLVRGGPTRSGRQWSAAAARRTAHGSLSAEWAETSAGYRNDNGFVEQAGVRRVQAEGIRRFGEAVIGPIAAHEVEAYAWAEARQALADTAGGAGRQETIQRQLHTGFWWTAPLNTEAWAHLRLDAGRARAGGRLHELPGVQAQWLFVPAAWITALNAEVDLGRRLDVEADRAVRGAVWLVEAKWRAALPSGGPQPLGLEVEQRLQQGSLQAPDGGRALTDAAARLLAVLHLNARDSLRLVGQTTRTDRAADAQAAVVGRHERQLDVSVVFQHRRGVGRQWALGASGQRVAARFGAGPDAVRRTAEVFAKATVEF